MSPLWIKPRKGELISPIGGDQTYYKVIGEQTGGHFAMLEQTVPPVQGPRKNVHTREDESFYILEGDFGFEIGDWSFVAGPGSFVFGPRDIPHRFWNAGTTTGRFLLTISSPGLEPFFTEFSNVLAAFPSDQVRQAEIAARYGLYFV